MSDRYAMLAQKLLSVQTRAGGHLMTAREILLESSRQKYPWIVKPVPKPSRKTMVELDLPRRPNSARTLSELPHVAQLSNLLAPHYGICFDANSWIQGNSLFDNPDHLSAWGEVQFEQSLILLGHTTLDLLPQSTAYSQEGSRL